ncbi:hypothetical protein [Qipengyuania nanhaisediminis]
MTVNERLFELGLTAGFERALAVWDEGRLRKIFVQARLPEHDLSLLRRRG